MECDFCVEFNVGRSDSDRIIVEDQDWLLLPTIGAFVPGYCLFMPIEHIEATADAGAALPSTAAAVERMRSLISAEYGPTVVAEHGSRGCDLGAGCCTHAHLHLIPVPDPCAVLDRYELTGGPGKRLPSLEELAEVSEGSYLYLSPEPDSHYYWPSAGFARQYVRRVCAELSGNGPKYDWREHSFASNAQATMECLRAASVNEGIKA